MESSTVPPVWQTTDPRFQARSGLVRAPLDRAPESEAIVTASESASSVDVYAPAAAVAVTATSTVHVPSSAASGDAARYGGKRSAPRSPTAVRAADASSASSRSTPSSPTSVREHEVRADAFARPRPSGPAFTGRSFSTATAGAFRGSVHPAVRSRAASAMMQHLRHFPGAAASVRSSILRGRPSSTFASVAGSRDEDAPLLSSGTTSPRPGSIFMSYFATPGSSSAPPVATTAQIRAFSNKTLYVRPRSASFTYDSTDDDDWDSVDDGESEQEEGEEGDGAAEPPHTVVNPVAAVLLLPSSAAAPSAAASQPLVAADPDVDPLSQSRRRRPSSAPRPYRASAMDALEDVNVGDPNRRVAQRIRSRSASIVPRQARQRASAILAAGRTEDDRALPEPGRAGSASTVREATSSDRSDGAREGETATQQDEVFSGSGASWIALGADDLAEAGVAVPLTPQAAAGAAGIEIGPAAGEWTLPRIQRRILAARAQAEVHQHFTSAMEVLLAVQMSLDVDYQEVALGGGAQPRSGFVLTPVQRAYYADLVGRELQYVTALWMAKLQSTDASLSPPPLSPLLGSPLEGWQQEQRPHTSSARSTPTGTVPAGFAGAAAGADPPMPRQDEAHADTTAGGGSSGHRLHSQQHGSNTTGSTTTASSTTIHARLTTSAEHRTVTSATYSLHETAGQAPASTAIPRRRPRPPQSPPSSVSVSPPPALRGQPQGGGTAGCDVSQPSSVLIQQPTRRAAPSPPRAHGSLSDSITATAEQLSADSSDSQAESVTATNGNGRPRRQRPAAPIRRRKYLMDAVIDDSSVIHELASVYDDQELGPVPHSTFNNTVAPAGQQRRRLTPEERQRSREHKRAGRQGSAAVPRGGADPSVGQVWSSRGRRPMRPQARPHPSDDAEEQRRASLLTSTAPEWQFRPSPMPMPSAQWYADHSHSTLVTLESPSAQADAAAGSASKGSPRSASLSSVSVSPSSDGEAGARSSTSRNTPERYRDDSTDAEAPGAMTRARRRTAQGTAFEADTPASPWHTAADDATATGTEAEGAQESRQHSRLRGQSDSPSRALSVNGTDVSEPHSRRVRRQRAIFTRRHRRGNASPNARLEPSCEVQLSSDSRIDAARQVPHRPANSPRSDAAHRRHSESSETTITLMPPTSAEHAAASQAAAGTAATNAAGAEALRQTTTHVQHTREVQSVVHCASTSISTVHTTRHHHSESAAAAPGRSGTEESDVREVEQTADFNSDVGGDSPPPTHPPRRPQERAEPSPQLPSRDVRTPEAGGDLRRFMSPPTSPPPTDEREDHRRQAAATGTVTCYSYFYAYKTIHGTDGQPHRRLVLCKGAPRPPSGDRTVQPHTARSPPPREPVTPLPQLAAVYTVPPALTTIALAEPPVDPSPLPTIVVQHVADEPLLIIPQPAMLNADILEARASPQASAVNAPSAASHSQLEAQLTDNERAQLERAARQSVAMPVAASPAASHSQLEAQLAAVEESRARAAEGQTGRAGGAVGVARTAASKAAAGGALSEVSLVLMEERFQREEDGFVALMSASGVPPSEWTKNGRRRIVFSGDVAEWWLRSEGYAAGSYFNAYRKVLPRQQATGMKWCGTPAAALRDWDRVNATPAESAAEESVGAPGPVHREESGAAGRVADVYIDASSPPAGEDHARAEAVSETEALPPPTESSAAPVPAHEAQDAPALAGAAPPVSSTGSSTAMSGAVPAVERGGVTPGTEADGRARLRDLRLRPTPGFGHFPAKPRHTVRPGSADLTSAIAYLRTGAVEAEVRTGVPSSYTALARPSLPHPPARDAWSQRLHSTSDAALLRPRAGAPAEWQLPGVGGLGRGRPASAGASRSRPW